MGSINLRCTKDGGSLSDVQVSVSVCKNSGPLLTAIPWIVCKNAAIVGARKGWWSLFNVTVVVQWQIVVPWWLQMLPWLLQMVPLLVVNVWIGQMRGIVFWWSIAGCYRGRVS